MALTTSADARQRRHFTASTRGWEGDGGGSLLLGIKFPSRVVWSHQEQAALCQTRRGVLFKTASSSASPGEGGGASRASPNVKPQYGQSAANNQDPDVCLRIFVFTSFLFIPALFLSIFSRRSPGKLDAPTMVDLKMTSAPESPARRVKGALEPQLE